MLDKYLVPVVRRPCRVIAQTLASAGISANQVSIVGFVAGILSIASIALGVFWLALLLLLLNRVADGVDGELARLTNPTDAGAFLDICLDFIFYSSFPLGFVFFNAEANSLPAAVLIASFVGTATSFLAFSNFAQKRGIEHPDFNYKGLYYLNGLAEGSETVIVFVLMCVFHTHFPLLAFTFAALCIATTVTRVVFGFSTLNN